MKLLFILLAQSVTGAVITIVALLLVAAIIGYFTSWFYAKSIYTPIITGLETEKAELIKQVNDLRNDITELNGKVDNLNVKISKLEKTLTEKDKEILKLKTPRE